MSSQHEVRLADASTRSNTATPDSGIHLNDGPDSDLGSRKRKRTEDTAEDLLKDSFAVRPYPPKPSTKIHTLQPLALITRSHLPLSALDLFSSSNSLPPSRLFETHVKALELEHRMGTQPMILIARLDDARTLYAVEREDRGLYTICKLGSWVNLHQLRAVATATLSNISALPDQRLELGNASQVSQSPRLDTDTVKFSKKKRLAIEAIQSMVKRPITGLLPDVENMDASLEENAAVTVEDPSTSVVDLERVAPPTAEETLENIRTQYFDALYLSKASLAYFAKGPLSRARAAFHLDYESSMDMGDLIKFLDDLILSSSIMDKKYRDGLPGCIALVDIEDHSGNDVSKAKTKKKRSNKKMKPGKNGLYPMEDEIIRKWWLNHDEDFEIGVPGRTREDVTKSRLAGLRIRETQLQMILILEVLALKPLASVLEDNALDLPGDSQDTVGGKTSKSRKSDNLAALLDVHIDRLCIWQSLSAEPLKVDNSESHAVAKPHKHSESITREFCVDIVAPFFSARLPEQCAVINKKLGGPVTVSKPKQTLARSASASGSAARPGAATKRPIPVKPKKSLTRILSDERERERRSASAQPNRKISLLRSATMPIMPGFKREGSEVSLSSIPSVDSQTLASVNKSGFASNKRFGHREVDFTSLARDENGKAKKQASIEDELKTAIAALKKPNRELAGKTFAETIEQRTMPLSQSRKSRKPVRNPLFQSVQISATPKNNRQTDVFAKTQGLSLSKSEPYEHDFVPPSSVSRIPPSSLPSEERTSFRGSLLATVQATPSRKPTNFPASTAPHTSQPADTHLNVNPLLTTIQATPSRKSESHTRRDSLNPTNAQPHRVPTSPTHVRRSSASLFSSIPDSAVKDPSGSILANNRKESFTFQETPVKKRPMSANTHCHPTLPALGINKENMSSLQVTNTTQAIKTPEESIYKSLGWDADDFDD